MQYGLYMVQSKFGMKVQGATVACYSDESPGLMGSYQTPKREGHRVGFFHVWFSLFDKTGVRMTGNWSYFSGRVAILVSVSITESGHV